MERMIIAREKLAEKIADDFKDKITGASESPVVNENPENVFFVGKLHARDEIVNDVTKSQVSIGSVGVDFYIKKEQLPNAKIKVFPRGEFYYRCYPTLQQQREEILSSANALVTNNFESFSDLESDYKSDPKKYEKVSVELVPVYEKLSIKNPDLYIQFTPCQFLNEKGDYGFFDKISTSNKDEKSNPNKELEEKINLLAKGLDEKDNFYKNAVHAKTTIGDLVTQESYESFIRRNAKEINIQQNWYLYFDVSITLIDDRYLISIALINDSKVYLNNKSHLSDSQKKDKTTIETFFNAGIDVQLDGADFVPIKSDYFIDDYKYDNEQKAIGLNSSIEYNQISNIISTQQMPTYKQKRLITKNEIDVKFEDLIDDSTDNQYDILRTIENAMTAEITEWKKEYETKKSGLNKEAKRKMRKDIEAFQFEINRFDFGIEVLENYPWASDGFVLMNKTISNTNKKFKSWRLFQIVFIVSVIPDIVACDKKCMTNKRDRQRTALESASLLYFPTGSGKTEAFLGILVFNLFFDRLRGKTCGVTGMLRYPLRLLSVQQVQRVADVLAQAELLRREEPRICDSEPFSLGYFVGDKNTPNNIDVKEAEKYLKMGSEKINEERILDHCPFCHGEVQLKFDKETYRLEHVCTECNAVLPFFMVDDEIYRYLPSVIISTVDKLALAGINPNFRNILDGASYKCKKHGYTSTGKCLVPQCKEDIEKVQMYDPAPTLIIQDELHLIRESLGTYASHYESFIDYYIKSLSSSKRDVKIIGATATITNYEKQIEQLYSRDVIRFPSESIHSNEDFYSKIDENDTQRIIMGFAPYGKSTVSAVGSSLKYMREVVDEYYKNPQKVLEIPGMPIDKVQEAREILEDYWIFIEYNNIKRDGNNVVGELDTQINSDLKSEGVPEFITSQMTGDVKFQDVKKTLSDIENTKNIFKGLNLITATSTISHGIDTDLFNMMFFYGIPGNTAEYVQAYSRTGRKYSSIVVDIMRPTRETDMSYLKNFDQFHEYKDKLIEPIPVNRWATKAIRKTIPGIFSALLLLYYDKKEQFRNQSLYYMKNIKEAINNESILKNEILSQMKQIYHCERKNVPNAKGSQYEKYIETFIDDIFSEIMATEWGNDRISKGFSKMGYPIMTNLRDTDAQVMIELDKRRNNK